MKYIVLLILLGVASNLWAQQTPRRLKEVEVSTYGRFQQDSAHIESTYREIIDARPTPMVRSIFPPAISVTAVAEKFSRKYKRKWAFQKRVVNYQQEQFIATRYYPALVRQLTLLEEEELVLFMNKYPMAYDFARTASPIEIKFWIKANFKDYKAKTALR
jgi:hypothetical protein